MHKNILIVVGITILFLGTCIIPSVAIDNPITPIISGNTLYVGGIGEGNYTKIQDAIDNASDGDTVFVYDDSSPYYENLIVSKTINLIGEDRYITIIDGQNITGKDTILITANSVTINGFTVQHCGTTVNDNGIQMGNNNNCTIKNNILTLNEDMGLGLINSHDNLISGNIVTKNFGDWYIGIDIYQSNGNIIINNSIYTNGYGICLSFSNNNIIKDNKIINAKTHSGIWAQSCYSETIVNNNISGNGGGGVEMYKCNDMNVSWNIVNNNGWNASNGRGIGLRTNSKNNIIRGNIIKNNKLNGIGIFGSDTQYNLIIENDIEDNYKQGIYIIGAKNNIIYHNNFVNNSENNGYDSGVNFWNNTHPIGGNYWNDYDGTDDDGDGLGDTPYGIANGDNKDYYPLINKWGKNTPYGYFTYEGINLTVTFNASASIDRDGTIISYDWEFSDGNTGTGKIINHTFPSYDNYTVSLTVTDNDGINHTASKIVEVEFNYAPDTPSKPSGPTIVQVDESEIYSTITNDPNNDTVQFRFDWDANGSHDYSDWSSFIPSGNTIDISQKWDIGGNYVVMAQARDEHGFTSNWSNGLTVLVNTPPVRPFDPEPERWANDVDVNADLSWSCSDPDGNPLTYNVFFEKNNPPDEMVSENQTGTTFDPGTLEYGTDYYWRIIAFDNYGGSSTGFIWEFTTEINLPPDLPSIDGPSGGKIGKNYVYTFTTVDPEGHDIYYYVDWGDGTNSSWKGPYTSGEEIIISHIWEEEGTYIIKAKAKDDLSAESGWSEFEVTIPRNKAVYKTLFLRFLEQYPILSKFFYLMRGR